MLCDVCCRWHRRSADHQKPMSEPKYFSFTIKKNIKIFASKELEPANFRYFFFYNYLTNLKNDVAISLTFSAIQGQVLCLLFYSGKLQEVFHSPGTLDTLSNQLMSHWNLSSLFYKMPQGWCHQHFGTVSPVVGSCSLTIAPRYFLGDCVKKTNKYFHSHRVYPSMWGDWTWGCGGCGGWEGGRAMRRR